MTLTRNEQKELRRLQQGRGRREQARFLAEGVRLVEWAARSGVSPSLVLCAPDLSDRAQAVCQHYQSRNVRVEQIPYALLDLLTDSRTPSGLVGVFALPPQDLTRWRDANRPERLLVLDGVSDPGNVGTLVRSAAAFGWRGVLATGESADPFGPKAVRASAGALFAIEAIRAAIDETRSFLQDEGYRVVATGTDATDGFGVLDAGEEPLALVIGSEHEGVSLELLEIADAALRVDQSTHVESLNAAVAGSILLWAESERRADRDPSNR